MIKEIKEKVLKKLDEAKERRNSKKVEKKKKQLDKEMKEEKLREELKKKETEVIVPLEEPEEKEEEKEPVKKGLVGQLAELNEKIDIISQKKVHEKKLKKKSFKMPFTVKSQLKKLALKNKVQVMLLQRTRNIRPVIGELRDGMLIIGDNIFEGAIKYTWLWGGKIPTFIVPEWDLSPISKEGITKMRIPLEAGELHKDTIDNQRSSEPQKIILRAIEAKENLMLKGKVATKTIIIVIVITLIIAAILFGGGAI